jgi:hypothetical protein
MSVEYGSVTLKAKDGFMHGYETIEPSAGDAGG